MTMSLDGFVADPSGSASRLYPDLQDLQGTDYMNAAIAVTRAVVMGRKTFEMGDADSYVGSYEFQVPIFVVTTNPPAKPPKQDENIGFTFVGDGVASAIEQAKAVAGEHVVQIVGGPRVIQAGLEAGLVDELRIDVMPVMLGAGLRLFDGVEAKLEKTRVQEVGPRTSFEFVVG
jgi:dihydrofolate reductase